MLLFILIFCEMTRIALKGLDLRSTGPLQPPRKLRPSAPNRRKEAG